ncbi:hypothetical protein JTB14_017026 [Gonioctena quinquepunctata]|nr:hypothetical protein JTB14_017026 [Gonioctena quinquepunctata]
MRSRTRDKTDKIEKSFDSKFSKMEKQLASIETALSNTSKCAFQNKIEIAHLATEMSDLEQHQRINSIRIQGLREEADNEYFLENTLQFFEHSLNISCTKQEIDSIFRINSRQDVAKPRPIIVKFVTNFKKNEIIGTRKLDQRRLGLLDGKCSYGVKNTTRKSSLITNRIFLTLMPELLLS